MTNAQDAQYVYYAQDGYGRPAAVYGYSAYGYSAYSYSAYGYSALDGYGRHAADRWWSSGRLGEHPEQSPLTF